MDHADRPGNHHNCAIEANGEPHARARSASNQLSPSAKLESDPAAAEDDRRPSSLENAHNFDPLTAVDMVTPQMFILGPEDGERGIFGPSTLFQREVGLETWQEGYNHNEIKWLKEKCPAVKQFPVPYWDSGSESVITRQETLLVSKPIEVRFPVENTDGILGISTLVVGESTTIALPSRTPPVSRLVASGARSRSACGSTRRASSRRAISPFARRSTSAARAPTP